jgi:hypothetical protein
MLVGNLLVKQKSVGQMLFGQSLLNQKNEVEQMLLKQNSVGQL